MENKQRKEEKKLKLQLQKSGRESNPDLQKVSAMAGNRTRINCLEGNYADHYTTIAVGC